MYLSTTPPPPVGIHNWVLVNKQIITDNTESESALMAKFVSANKECDSSF